MTSYYRADITVLPDHETSLSPEEWAGVQHQKALADSRGLTFHRLTRREDDPYRVLFEAWADKPE